MASTTTQISIANRALQLLGYKPINSLQDNDRGARAINRAYLPVLNGMLREGIWNFAVTRASIAASATAPAFGKAYYFQLPGDFIDLAPPDETFNFNYTDWQIEGQQIASDNAGPLQIRYITSSVTESMFDTLFAEAFAAKLAMETCEELTQSNTKMATLSKIYEDKVESARKRNAFEKRPTKPAEDTWISKRS